MKTILLIALAILWLVMFVDNEIKMARLRHKRLQDKAGESR